MVLALGKFMVSKYAAPGGAGAAAGGVGGLDFGLPTVGGNQFGIDGSPQLVPSNVYPNLILPGGEVIPGGGGTPLPGGVDVGMPAYADHPGPFWDPTSNGGVFGRDAISGGRGRGKTFGSRILNVNLPKIISAGQQFSIIVTYVHQGDSFTTYKVKVQIPVLQITEMSQEKRIANGGQDNIVMNLTAPAPLPDAPVTGTVELIQTEGTDLTVDSEVITIPTEKVPNPPPPVPPDQTPVPMPMPEPSPPPEVPPPPPVPLPPVLQQINLNITRGEDGGSTAIIIEASGLEPSEPATLFVYLSENPNWRGWRGRNHLGWNKDGNFDITKFMDKYKDVDISKITPAGSTATAKSNFAYSSYPSTVSVQCMTSMGNGLRLNNMPTVSSIQNQVRSQINTQMIRNSVTQAVMQRGAPQNVAIIAAQAAERAAFTVPGNNKVVVAAAAASEAAKAVVASAGGGAQAVAIAGNAAASAVASSGGGTQASAAAGNAVAQAVAGAGVNQAVAITAGAAAAAAAGSAVAVSIAPGEPYPGMPSPTGPPFDPNQLPRPRPIFKRQRVSLTASEMGTLRHVVRVSSATPLTKLHGYVIVYGHRTKKHSGRRQFSL